jgi:hypothetical protein
VPLAKAPPDTWAGVTAFMRTRRTWHRNASPTSPNSRSLSDNLRMTATRAAAHGQGFSLAVFTPHCLNTLNIDNIKLKRCLPMWAGRKLTNPGNCCFHLTNVPGVSAMLAVRHCRGCKLTAGTIHSRQPVPAEHYPGLSSAGLGPLAVPSDTLAPTPPGQVGPIQAPHA